MTRKSRPKINRELEAAKKRLAEINAGIVACYETLEVGQRKKALLEARIVALSTLPHHDEKEQTE